MCLSSQIPPSEIEQILVSDPDISLVCVVGYPDENYGELPRAYIVKRPGSKLTVQGVHNLLEGEAKLFVNIISTIMRFN